MAKLEIKYRTSGGALPPRVPKVSFDTWAGSSDMKKENGSQPQPWHCPLHVAGCTHGLELIYPHDLEIRVTNDNGKIRIDWDHTVDPAGAGVARNFTLSAPQPSQNYLFATGLDLKPPAGYILRAEPHPRFFSDSTGTAPAAMYGHIQSEWWPKKLFMVFKIPFPGQTHIFRKGEPYAQVIFIPDDSFTAAQMTPDEEKHRQDLEEAIRISKSLIGKRVWHSAGGVEFNDHYTVLSRVYKEEGLAGVERVAQDALQRYKSCVPAGLSTADYLNLAAQYRSEARCTEAKEVLHHIMRTDPSCAEVFNRMSQLEWELSAPLDAIRTLRRAVQMQPSEPRYRRNLGEYYRRLGKPAEALEQFTIALQFKPGDAELLTVKSVVLAQLGRLPEAFQYCQKAVEITPNDAASRLVLGMILKQGGRSLEARSCFEAALKLNPNFTPARDALNQLAAALELVPQH